MLREPGARGLDVAADLLHERLEGIEAALVAQPVQEIDGDMAAVDVLVEVEQVHLEQAAGAVHRGPGAHVGHTLYRFPIQPEHLDREHALYRRAMTMQEDIGGGEADGASPLVSVRHPSHHPVGSAEQLLGRPYRMMGRVAHGDKRGRTIGFPTANIFLHRHRTPIQGVFAVEVFGLDREPVQGVANVGTRPTVDGTRSLLEVHLFDFDQDIYGRHVAVDFLHRLRDERRFDSFEALMQQIRRDVEAARAWFAQHAA